jgi:predicted P-loop ATPase
MEDGMEAKVDEWIVRVDETFLRLRWSDRATQEKACQSIEEEHEGEAAAKLRQLFEAERARIEAASFSLAPRIEAGPKPQPKPQEPPPQPVEEEPKKAAVAVVGVVGDLRERYKARLARARAEERRGGVVIALKPQAQAKPEPEEKKATVDRPKEVAGAGTGVARVRTGLTFQHSKSPTGIPASLENAIVAIDAIGAECRYDVFHDRIIVKGHECGVRGDAHENLENITLKVRQAVLERFGFDPSPNFTFDALKLRCLDHIFDPVRDYLDGLRWDGVKRLDNWLVVYCGAEDTPLNRAIGRKMLVAAVRRVREPGCKFDYIVVLEGEQGVGKSSLLRVLAGEENFSDNEILGLHKQEQQEAIQGVWLYEVAELEGLSKSEVTKVKLFASKTVDGARPAYGRSRVDRPRRCIFVATTNEDTYLRDTTGNRRFWPVCVGVIDLDGIRRDRDQLWAEAAIVEAGGEPLVIPQHLWPDVAIQQKARMELDPWEDVLAPVLAGMIRNEHQVPGSFVNASDERGNPEWRASTDFLLTDVLNLPKERQNNNHAKRLAGIMRGLGWIRSEEVMRFGKEVKRGFTKSCGGGM